MAQRWKERLQEEKKKLLGQLSTIEDSSKILTERQMNTIYQLVERTFDRLQNDESDLSSSDIEPTENLWSCLTARNEEMYKLYNKFSRRLYCLEILLYQKDYAYALRKIDNYKKNCETLSSTESLARSPSASINNAFCYTYKPEYHCYAYNQIKNIIEDEYVSITLKEHIIFEVLPQKTKEDYEYLQHVTLDQVLRVKRYLSDKTFVTNQLSSMSLNGYSSPTPPLEKAYFQKRIRLNDIICLGEESPIEKAKGKLHLLIGKPLDLDKSTQRHKTGKKKPVRPSAYHNTQSEVGQWDTSRKLLTAAKTIERCLTGRKPDGLFDNRRVTSRTRYPVYTEKKKPGQRRPTTLVKSFRI